MNCFVSVECMFCVIIESKCFFTVLSLDMSDFLSEQIKSVTIFITCKVTLYVYGRVTQISRISHSEELGSSLWI